MELKTQNYQALFSNSDKILYQSGVKVLCKTNNVLELGSATSDLSCNALPP
jgi:hypothetical protein